MTTSCGYCGSSHDTEEQILRHKEFMNEFYPEVHYYPEIIKEKGDCLSQIRLATKRFWWSKGKEEE